MRILKFLLILCLLFSHHLLFSSNNSSTPKKKKNPLDNNGLPFLTVDVGAGAWYSSRQSGMSNEKLPMAIYLEYGKTQSPFGVMLGANFYTTYELDNFLLNPNYFSLAATYQPLKKKKAFRKFNIYGLAGVNLSYSRFTEKEYSGIVNYEHKVDKEIGYGIQLGAGVAYRFKNMEIGPVFMYHTGSSDFLAGYFTKQSFNTGSLQLNILFKYYFVFDRNKNVCPAYRSSFR